MIRFVQDVFRAAIRPGKTYRSWLAEPRALGRGLRSVATVGGLYAATSLGLAVAGAVPLVPPVLALPDENHYFWQMILVLPGLLLIWLLAAALLRLLAGPRGGPPGRFRSAAALCGPSLAVPLAVAWLPQFVQMVLMLLGMGQEEFVDIVSAPGIWQVIYLATYAAAALWAVLLFARAARVSQGAGGWSSWIGGFLAAALTGAPIALFLR
jgi:hypothetical protein